MRTEVFHQLAQSKIAYIDRSAFENKIADLPAASFCKGGICGSDIEEQILEKTSVASLQQVKQHLVNTRIPVTDKFITGRRRRFDGRSCEIDLSISKSPCPPDSKLVTLPVSIKGCGVRAECIPSHGWHVDGLLPLHVAFMEVINERIIRSILRKTEAALDTARIYAVISTGFNITYASGVTEPAGLLVRESLTRSEATELPSHGSYLHRQQIAIELAFRQFGLTSCADFFVSFKRIGNSMALMWDNQIQGYYSINQFVRLCRRLDLDENFMANRINIQMALNHSLVPCITDFEHYRFKPNFIFNLLSIVNDRPFAWGGVIRCDCSTNFCQPPRSLYGPLAELDTIQVPPDFIVPPAYCLLLQDNGLPKLHIEATLLARNFTTLRVDVGGVAAKLNELVQDVLEKIGVA